MRKRTGLAVSFMAAVAMACPIVMAQQDNSARQRTDTTTDAARNQPAAASGDRAAGTARDATNGAGADARAEARTAGARDQGNMDQKCAMHIADTNNFEVQAGRLAAQKSQQQDIKRFGQMMVDEHTQAQQQLQQIGQKKGMQFSQQLMPVHQAMLEELSKLDGQEFDRAYLYGQIGGHTKTALKLRDAKSELQDAELKQYAATILPKVQQHLQEAQRIARADEATTAGARIGHEGAPANGRNAGDAQSGRTSEGAAPSPAGAK
jgi:putative membrane protein